MANEKRLIDSVDESIKQYAEHGDILQFISDVRFAVINAPTVDAVEVVHGRWEKAEYYGWIRCDKCKDVYLEEGYLGNGKWIYCPNCGAKMDRGEET